MSDPKKNTHGTPGPDEEADTASGGAPEDPDTSKDLNISEDPDTSEDPGSGKDTDEILEDQTTDEDGKPLENPSGG
ncbi:hypothetical protein [Microbacterium alcoholitolerans]|uniref:hypothetical protein n=1 Tax=unclassified Microbacterium TaxID=2609290 RepID=UPI003D174F29